MRYRFIMLVAVATILSAAAATRAAEVTPAKAGKSEIAVPEPKTKAPLVLTIKPVEGVKIDGAGTGRISYAGIDPLSQTRLEHIFLVGNDTKTTVVINSVVASCNCTSADLADDGDGRRTLKPGMEALVKMAVDLSGLHGPLDKFVRLYAVDSKEPVATLEMTGFIQELARFSTNALDFGRLALGVGKTLPLTVSVDARLQDLKAIPPLVSSSPDVQLNLKSETMQPNPAGAKEVVRQYDVTLVPHAGNSLVKGTIKFGVLPVSPMPDAKSALPDIRKLLKRENDVKPGVAPAPTPGKSPPSVPGKEDSIVAPTTSGPAEGSISPSSAAATLNHLTCDFSAISTGVFVMEPGLVLVMDAKVGQAVSKTVKVTAAQRSAFTDLKITSLNPNVKFKLTPLPQGLDGSGASASLEISFTPDTEGPFQAVLMLTTPNGERTLLPVAARVSP